MGDITCDDDLSVPECSLSLEQSLVTYLRMWGDDPRSLTVTGRSVEDEIRSLLEPYIDECLSYGPPSLSEWWCDGIMYLEITRTAHDEYNLIGVAWIGTYQELAPFEIDIELAPAGADRFSKSVFRIGALDERGRPKTVVHRLDARTLVKTRPRENRDWAMAVELTLPERH